MENTRRYSSTAVGSVILTVGAMIASWPATAFLLMYLRQPQDTGALMVGSFFSLLAVVLWGSAGWGWSKFHKTGKSSVLLPTKKNQ